MENQGFTVFPHVFSLIEMKDLDARLQSFAESHDRRLDSSVAFLQKVAERDEAILRFARRPELVTIATSLLGPDIDLYFNQLVVKNPGPQEAFSWHQDDAYGPVEPTPYLTVWISITDATQANGCVWALPGSWRRGLLPHESSSFGLSCHSMEDPDQGTPVETHSGDVACFWSLTVHKSGPNRTDMPRKAMIFQYSRPGLRHKSSGMTIASKLKIARDGQPLVNA